MARKKMQEPERWITVNGQHLPVYPGGVIGQPGQEEPKKNDNKDGYTVMMNGGAGKGFVEAKTFKSAAEADDYITKQVKSGNGSATDWNVKKNGKMGNWSDTTSRNADDIYNERKNIKGNTNARPDDIKRIMTKEQRRDNAFQPATTSRNARYDTSRANNMSLVSKSSSALKTMYRNASPEEKKIIAAELASRGFYRKNDRWTSMGGGR